MSYVDLAVKERIKQITFSINEKERVLGNITKRADALKTEIATLEIERDELVAGLEDS